MKLFLVFIFCSLTPIVFANNHNRNCICVDAERCNYKFSSLIEPRNVKYPCPRNLVCCKPTHVVPLDMSDFFDSTNEPTDDYNQPIINKPTIIKPHVKKPYRQCGLRSKIPAYKRVVLPASYAALGEFPWQAAILKNYKEGYVFISSGSLVDKTAILTTAHSLENLAPSETLVRLAENNIQADPKKKYQHVNVKASQILIKEDFNSDTLENDFAVVCLDKPIKFNEVVSPICLPEPEDLNDQSIYSDKKNCVVSGWGKGSYNGNYSTVLRKANLEIVPSDKCQTLIRKRISDPTYILDKSFICAGGELGKDACTGDAGGPLSCYDKYGQQELQGLVSWGIGCGEPDVPGIYSNVRDPASLAWIKKAIKVCNIQHLSNKPTQPRIQFNEE